MTSKTKQATHMRRASWIVVFLAASTVVFALPDKGQAQNQFIGGGLASAAGAIAAHQKSTQNETASKRSNAGQEGASSAVAGTDPSVQSIQSKAGKGSSGGQEHIEAMTQYYLPKYTDGNGTLGNTVAPIFETAGGNVGIGTTDPRSGLAVYQTQAAGRVNIDFLNNTAADNADRVRLRLGPFNGFAGTDLYPYMESYVQIGAGSGSSGLAFGTYNAESFSLQERMRIDKSGNVGIGTTAPNYRLDVAGTTNIQNTLTQGGGYAYIGSFNTPTRPAAGNALGVAWNYSGGQRDIDLWNTDQNNTSGTSFSFKQLTGVSSHSDLVTFLANGNVGIGITAPSAKLHVAGTTNLIGNVSIGTISSNANLDVQGSVTVSGNIAAKYQDVAEWVPASRAIPAGSVVVLDAERSNHVLPSSRAYDTRVAGVVSASPGVILGEGGAGKVMVATTGRVRVKVDATGGPIRVGDLLVTSNKEGIAMRSQPLDLGGTPIHRPGTLIGKALEPLDKGVGEILVLLSLQ